MKTSASRRRFLLGAGGLALGLPFLDAMRSERTAQAATFPKRLIVFFHDAGTLVDEWTPTATGSSYQLPSILSPLIPFQKKITLVSGLSNHIRELCTKATFHVSGKTSLLTAQPFADLTAIDSWAAGPSVEQVIADRIGPVTPLKTIDVAGGSNYSGYEGTISFAAADQPVTTKVDSPVKLFTSLFGGFDNSQSVAELEKIKARRLSVLDAVSENFRGYRSRLGAADRQRLDAHAAYVEGLETRLKNAAVTTCSVPAMPTGVVDHDTIFRSFSDLVSYAISCDMTRVATIYVGTQQNSQFPWTGVQIPNGDWHGFIHAGPGAVPSPDRDVRRTVFRWHMEELAHLLSKLDSIPEGYDGETLLDHSLVLSLSDFSNAATHSATRLPIILAGGLSGALKTGQHLACDHRSHSDLLLTILNLFGYDDKTFGLAPYCTGPLAGLSS